MSMETITDEQLENRATELARDRYEHRLIDQMLVGKSPGPTIDAIKVIAYGDATLERLKDARESLLMIECYRNLVDQALRGQKSDTRNYTLHPIDQHIPHLRSLLGLTPEQP